MRPAMSTQATLSEYVLVFDRMLTYLWDWRYGPRRTESPAATDWRHARQRFNLSKNQHGRIIMNGSTAFASAALESKFHRARLLVASLLAGGAVALSANAGAQALLVKNSVHGLPADLTVLANGSFTRCGPNGVVTVFSGSTTLTGNTVITYEPATLPTGQIVLRAVTRTIYSGDFQTVAPNQQPNCVIDPRDTFRVIYSVVGESAAGNSAFRQTSVLSPISTFSEPKTLSTTIEARTEKALDVSTLGSPVTPTAITRGQFRKWSVDYADAFGASSVSTPTLELTQPGFVFGVLTNISKAKMWIEGTGSGQLCLRVAGETQCQAMSSATNLSVGGVTVDTNDTTDSPFNTRTRLVSWRFRLETGFPAGNYTATMRAEDVDNILYDVNGEPTNLNLLPWKSLSLPITVN